MWYSHVYQTKVQVDKDLKTLHSKKIAQELKSMCGNAYRPRKFDSKLEVLRRFFILASITTQVQKFQPLSQLQSFPPYFNFKNQPNPHLPNQVQHESQNTFLPNALGLYEKF